MANALEIAQWVVSKLEDDPNHLGVIKDLGDGAGLTRMGITQRWHGSDVPPEFFTTMPDDEAYTLAVDFYVRFYCEPLRVSEFMSDDVAACLVSFAVNSTIKKAVKILQTVLGVKINGSLDSATLAVVNAQDPKVVARSFRDVWANFYRRLVLLEPRKEKFLGLWLRRVERVYPA